MWEAASSPVARLLFLAAPHLALGSLWRRRQRLNLLIFFLAIRYPFLFVPNADPPMCSRFPLSPGTYCSFQCIDGFYMKGSEVRVYQQDKSWTGSETTCELKDTFLHKSQSSKKVSSSNPRLEDFLMVK